MTCYALQATSRETSGALALVAVDMTTGTTRQAAQWTGAVESSFHTAGLTYGQGVYVAAGYDGNGFSWYALDPTRGEVRNLGSAGNLSAVAWTGTDWLAPLEGMAGMARYPSLEALAAHAPRCSFSGGQYSRFTVAGELIYGAWHSTDQVDVHELSTGKLLRTVQLQGWDQWVMGIAVAGGSLYLLGTSGLSSTPIAAFDLDTGAQLGQVSLPGSFSGLSCTTSPPH